MTDIELTKICTKVNHKADLKKHDKMWFINKLRNGIAHQNIESLNEDDKWIGIRLWNEHNGVKNFEIIFTIEELKKIAMKIANEYLDENSLAI